MKNYNITRIDSKGRILIPIHLRNYLKTKKGTEVILIPDQGKEQLKIMPLLKGRTAEVKFLIHNIPGSYAHIANVLSDFGMDIIMSESRTLLKGKLAEWEMLIDISKSNRNIEQLKKSFFDSDIVQTVDINNK